jgi:aminoglycoside 6'-N-acetyltransferase I
MKDSQPLRTIRPANAADRDEWLRLRQALWPEESVQSLINDQQVWLREVDCRAFVAERAGGGLCGFLEAAIRPCNVNGVIGRFGYIEGWFVDPDVREQGIGSALVQAAEDWIKAQGCLEILSDARINNQLSQTAHTALGFAEVERLVHYRKLLD